MGASAGGVQAFRKLLGDLPPDLPASILLVQHTSPNGPGLLPRVIGRDASLPVQNAVDGEKLQPGHVYVAPPDHHLLVHGPQLCLSRGPRENRHRPSIDALFRSAAGSFGSRVVGVVLTGYLDDGTAGLAAIKTQDGVAVVQDPDDAQAPAMPKSALRYVPVDHCLPLSEIPSVLVRLVAERAIPADRTLQPYTEITSMSPEEMTARFGAPSSFVCPECHGSLWETATGRALQYRCHVGHRYSPESLLAEHAERLEASLWSTIQLLDEEAALLRSLAQRGIESPTAGPELQRRAGDCEQQAKSIRALFRMSDRQ
jgi:two-component system, chemotaxis family, protein-glutamate methylesterase/glutaminase